MVLTAVVLWSMNAVVAKIAVDSGGLSPLQLAELRALGGAAILVGALALFRPAALIISLRDVGFLSLFGVAGLAAVHFFYFVAITRLDIGIALVIQYLAPVLIAIWARFVLKRPVRRRLWIALPLSLVGLSLVVDIWGEGDVDGVGVAAALAGAFAFALYILMANRGLENRDIYSLLAWGFVFATLFWSIAQPWWNFPTQTMLGDASLMGRLPDIEIPVWSLVAYIVVLGTVLPWLLEIGALRHLSALSVTTVSMAEPIVAGLAAFLWLGEAIVQMQIVGASLVFGGILLAQTARAPVAPKVANSGEKHAPSQRTFPR
jgi:drug/metabolite transporter (DMT)-like permease